MASLKAKTCPKVRTSSHVSQACRAYSSRSLMPFIAAEARSLRLPAAVAAPILRLNEDGLAQILHSVADLALDAHVGDLTKAVQVGAGAIAVQRVAVAVGAGHGDQCHQNRSCFASCSFILPPDCFRFCRMCTAHCAADSTQRDRCPSGPPPVPPAGRRKFLG